MYTSYLVVVLATLSIPLVSLLIARLLRSKGFFYNASRPAGLLDLEQPFFLIGMIFSISISYVGLNLTRSHPQMDDASEIDFLEVDDWLIIPRTTKVKKKPPPSPEIIDEVEEIEEQELEPMFLDVSVPELSTGQLLNEQTLPDRAPLPPIHEDPPAELLVFAEQMPQFPGCEEAPTEVEKKACTDRKLLAYMANHLRYPTIASQNGIQGTCVVRFVIDTEGTVTDCELVRDIGGGCGEEALRVIQSMNTLVGKWKPGKQGNQKVKVRYSLPVQFKLH